MSENSGIKEKEQKKAKLMAEQRAFRESKMNKSEKTLKEESTPQSEDQKVAAILKPVIINKGDA